MKSPVLLLTNYIVCDFVMVYTCCVPGCKTGYTSCKNEEKIGLFKFPSSEEFRQKWIAAIPRKNWQVTKTTKISAKHFTDEDIENQSTDLHDKRRTDRPTQTLKRLKLKSTAIPRIFPNLPKYLSLTIPKERSKVSTSAARQEKQDAILQQSTKEMFLQDRKTKYILMLNCQMVTCLF